ncbi:MAG: hypothetical protein Q9219_003918 [cf. Caloplaca sp. 3 TL-2023]
MNTPNQVEDIDANHDALVIGVTIFLSAVALAALLLRLASKRIRRASLDWDDYLAIISWLVSLAISIMMAYSTQCAGFGRHAISLSPKEIKTYLKISLALQVLQPSALAAAKISVLYILHHIFATRAFRMAARILGVIVIIWWIINTLAFALTCNPIGTINGTSIPRHCGIFAPILLFSGIPWILTDFAIVIAPLFVIKNLQLNTRDKLGLCALFLSGGVTSIISCIRFNAIFHAAEHTGDPTWDLVDPGLWSIAEANITVFCACIITAKPALRYVFHFNDGATTYFRTHQWSKLRSTYTHRTSTEGSYTGPRSAAATTTHNNTLVGSASPSATTIQKSSVAEVSLVGQKDDGISMHDYQV